MRSQLAVSPSPWYSWVDSRMECSHRQKYHTTASPPPKSYSLRRTSNSSSQSHAARRCLASIHHRRNHGVPPGCHIPWLQVFECMESRKWRGSALHSAELDTRLIDASGAFPDLYVVRKVGLSISLGFLSEMAISCSKMLLAQWPLRYVVQRPRSIHGSHWSMDTRRECHTRKVHDRCGIEDSLVP